MTLESIGVAVADDGTIVASAFDVLVNPVLGSDTSSFGCADADAEGNSAFSAYTKPNQSRIWYNSDQGRWDALVPKNDSGISGSDHYILKDVTGRQTFTAVELEDRDFARPDVFWDNVNHKLYVFGSHPSSSEFWRLNYDAVADRYDIEVGSPEAGIPVPGIIQPGGCIGINSPGTLYVSPNGHVWVAIMTADAGLQVQHSSDGGATWLSAPVTLGNGFKVGVTAWTHFENGGETYVGVFAGENGEFQRPSLFYYWHIAQDLDPTNLDNWADDTPNIPHPMGREHSDDHVSSARDASGNQYFVVKTEGGDPTDPLIKLFKRTPAGDWSQYVVTKTEEAPEESRPSIVIDDENREIYIYSNGAEVVSDSERTGVHKAAVSLDTLDRLATESPETIFSSPNTVFTDILTPRQAVNAQSGIVALVHNRTTDTVWFSQETIAPNLQLVTVPNIEGLPLAEAQARMTATGLRVGAMTVARDKAAPEGIVISQNPAGGASVVVGTAVDVVVADGTNVMYLPYIGN